MADPDLFLFVSHIREDRPAALEIVEELERRGVPCWIAPRDVRPGKPFDDEIEDAIEKSRAMLLVFSERCNEHDYIRREVTVAGESHKVIIPFRIEDAQPRRGLRVRLSDLHWIDGFVSRERALDQVVKAIPPCNGSKPPPPPPPETLGYILRRTIARNPGLTFQQIKNIAIRAGISPDRLKDSSVYAYQYDALAVLVAAVDEDWQPPTSALKETPQEVSKRDPVEILREKKQKFKQNSLGYIVRCAIARNRGLTVKQLKEIAVKNGIPPESIKDSSVSTFRSDGLGVLQAAIDMGWRPPQSY